MRPFPTRQFVVGFMLFAAGCSAEREPPRTAVESVPREVNRDAAIASARHDASLNYRELWVSEIAAQRAGAFWIVELRSASGSGLRYAISTHDGTIRQRSAFQ